MAIKEFLRNMIDIPEKVAIVVGGTLIAFSAYAAALFPVGIAALELTGAELFVGGGVSLGITNAVLPKEN